MYDLVLVITIMIFMCSVNIIIVKNNTHFKHATVEYKQCMSTAFDMNYGV